MDQVSMVFEHLLRLGNSPTGGVYLQPPVGQPRLHKCRPRPRAPSVAPCRKATSHVKGQALRLG